MIYTLAISILISSSLLLTWFNSNMAMLILFILKKLGWKKNDTTFAMSYPDNPLLWTDTEWESFKLDYLGPFWGHLLSCRFCLCWHICFWVNIITSLVSVTLSVITFYQMFLLLLLTPTQPIIVHLLYKITNLKEN